MDFILKAARRFPETRPVKAEVANPEGERAQLAGLSALRQRHVRAVAPQERVGPGGRQRVPRLLLRLLPSGPGCPARRPLFRDQDPVRGGEPSAAAGPVGPEGARLRALLPGPPDRRHPPREPLPDRQEHPQDPETERAGPRRVAQRFGEMVAGHPKLGELVYRGHGRWVPGPGSL